MKNNKITKAAQISNFKVKVYRYWKDDSGCEGHDGFFISRVFAVNENKFLVYDNGEFSACFFDDEEDSAPDGFVWVDFTELIPDSPNGDKMKLKVELIEE